LGRPCHSIVWHAKDPSGRPEAKLSVELGGLERLGKTASTREVAISRMQDTSVDKILFHTLHQTSSRVKFQLMV